MLKEDNIVSAANFPGEPKTPPPASNNESIYVCPVIY